MTECILTVTIAAATLAAGLCFGMPASRASSMVSGQKRRRRQLLGLRIQDLPGVRAGAPGISFCNVNPSGPPAAAAPAPRGRR